MERAKSAVRPFPNADIKKLSVSPKDVVHLHGCFVLYFADVAGYALNANRLHRRPREALASGRKFLSQSFFEKYPQYAHLRAQITPTETPALYHDMEVAERCRVDLIPVLDGLLQPAV